MINFDLNCANQLLINDRLGDEEKLILSELKQEFEKEFGPENFVLVASSGSSQGAQQSVKLIALQINRILNSANRVNKYLKASVNDHWGLALPPFHVAGIGVYARAYLLQSHVYILNWNIHTFAEQILKKNISYLSLVPTQVFDLVANQVQAPKCLKVVFVGGGQLNGDLKTRFLQLGWPVIESYGMTETASMIALREPQQSDFKVMDNVSVKTENNILSIMCDSLLTASVQKNNNKIEIKYFADNEWFKSDDQADIIVTGGEVFLKFLGRKTDYIKILGEGVSLVELRDLLTQIILEKKLNPNSFALLASPDDRKQNQVSLVYEKQVSEAEHQDVLSEFNIKCRSYERIEQSYKVLKIPRTELGKLKIDELRHIIERSE